jgi:hypothetical protein
VPVTAPRRVDQTPLETNDVLVVTIGTLLWGIGFLILLGFHGTLQRHDATWWLWVPVAGFGLGLLGLVYVIRRRSRLLATSRSDSAENT